MSTSSMYLPSKRLIDVVGALAGLVLASPFVVAAALAVRLSSPGPVIFQQQRLGRFGRPFVMYKFRTMRHAPKPTESSSLVTAGGDTRITSVGRFLRRYKLDELPQLVNVLKGDMSLVGPRPEVEKYARYYPAEYERILSVRPGITDLATLAFRNEEQILARSDEPERAYIAEVLPAKIRLYFRYLEEQSLRTDLSIILRTLGSVLR
jgi:lipopolysaccharide/colanic/teichoic acid biosynthesis glycosyltransferase